MNVVGDLSQCFFAHSGFEGVDVHVVDDLAIGAIIDVVEVGHVKIGGNQWLKGGVVGGNHDVYDIFWLVQI